MIGPPARRGDGFLRQSSTSSQLSCLGLIAMDLGWPAGARAHIPARPWLSLIFCGLEGPTSNGAAFIFISLCVFPRSHIFIHNYKAMTMMQVGPHMSPQERYIACATFLILAYTTRPLLFFLLALARPDVVKCASSVSAATASGPTAIASHDAQHSAYCTFFPL